MQAVTAMRSELNNDSHPLSPKRREGFQELSYIQKLDQCFSVIQKKDEVSQRDYQKALRDYRSLISRLGAMKRRFLQLPVYPVSIQQFPPAWVLKYPALLNIYYRLYLIPCSLLESGLVFDEPELEKMIFRHMQSWQGGDPAGEYRESACYAGAVQLLDRCSRASSVLKKQVMQGVKKFCAEAGCDKVLERIDCNYTTYFPVQQAANRSKQKPGIVIMTGETGAA